MRAQLRGGVENGPMGMRARNNCTNAKPIRALGAGNQPMREQPGVTALQGSGYHESYYAAREKYVHAVGSIQGTGETGEELV